MVLGKIFQLWSLVNVHSHNQGYKYTLSQMVKFLRSGKVLSIHGSVCLCIFKFGLFYILSEYNFLFIVS